MTKHSRHPEGIIDAIESLQNVPDGMLEVFMCKVDDELAPDNSLEDIWFDLVDNWFERKSFAK